MGSMREKSFDCKVNINYGDVTETIRANTYQEIRYVPTLMTIIITTELTMLTTIPSNHVTTISLS